MKKNYTISTEELESIEAYLRGEITAEQKKNFDTKIDNEALWASKVQEVRLLLTGIEAASLQERLDGYHAVLKKNHPPLKKAKLFSINRKWLVAAAVSLLVAVAGLVYFFADNRHQKIYANYYKPDPGLMSAMGIQDNYVFNKAMLDYKTGQYKKAIAAWGTLKNSTAANDTLQYFLGAAQQADGNTAAAQALLQSIAADSTKPFYKDACWYLGLALVKQGDIDKAIPYIEKSERPESAELMHQLK